MYNNIIFVGGIHGAGKSTICKDICNRFNISYLSASAVLKWEDINEDIRNKKVADIPHTQDRLITGLNNIVEKDKLYLLDGHLCLFDSTGDVKPVPLQTFIDIDPILILILLNDPIEIQKRLSERDNKVYSVEDLEKMQQAEVEHGNFVANKLSVRSSSHKVKDVDQIYSEIDLIVKG